MDIDISRQQFKPSGILHRPLAHLLLIAGLAFIAYSNTFQVPFVFDDIYEIYENPIIRDLNYFLNPSSARGFPAYHGLQMRTVGYFTLALNYQFGGTDVTGYHVFNLAVHILTALLVYKLIFRTLRLPLHGGTETARSAPLIALLIALLFAVHPIQTQAVTYIIQRVTSLTAFFCLLSLTSYIDARLQTERNRTGRALAWFLLSFASAVAAMKTKEIAFTLPVVIALYEFLFLRGTLRRRLLYLTPLLLTMLIIPLSLTGTSKPLGDILSDASLVSRVDQTVSRSDYLFTQFRVIVTYFRMLVLPVGQNLDHAYPVHPDFLSPEVLLSFLFLATLFAFAIYLCFITRPVSTLDTQPSRRPVDPAARLVGFGILWFFLTLAVESSVIPINDVMNEHRLYLPSVGFFLALVVAAWLMVRRLKTRWVGIGKVAVAFSMALVLTLAGATYARNLLWQDALRLWQDVVAKSPQNARGYNNIGICYDDRGEYEKAIPYFQKAIAVDPGHAEALFNLGIAHAALKQTDTAIFYYHKALAFRPTDPKIFYNLGVAYMSKGQMGPAAGAFQEALRLDPKMSQARMFLEYARKQVGK